MNLMQAKIKPSLSLDMSMQHSVNSAQSPNFWRYGFFNLALLVLLGIWFWQQNRPITLGMPNLAKNEKLQCISYSPYYHDGQTPLKPDTQISAAQIDHDLQLLAQRFNCVRIYSVGQGLDYVPAAASKLGLKVLLGAWIGWVNADNDNELKLATNLANQYPDVVKGLIVGNEVLLRGEQTEMAMQAYLQRAKQDTKVPVTYADVWEYWLKHKALEKSVDFVTVHILPYWEDDPQSIDHAIVHTSTVMDKLAENFRKPVLIGETGWPSQGRQRNESTPSQINQARYLREFVQLADSKHWNYNLIEAIDQPWKRQLEGTVGGYWGLYTSELQPKFDFSGPIAERNDHWHSLCWPLLGLLLSVSFTLMRGKRRPSAVLSAASLGALIGAWGMLTTEYLMIVCRDKSEWLVSGSLGLFALLGLLAILSAIAGGNRSTAKIMANTALLVMLSGAVFTSWLLWADGRYRDFPVVIYALPALQLSLGIWLAGINIKPAWWPYYLLSSAAIGSSIACLWIEPDNVRAIIWVGIAILLAFASWPGNNKMSIEKA